jgi:phage tail sheath protein FI
MATYKTPDVYIDEISMFPPSIAEVETAVPAFIGYTEKRERNGKELLQPNGLPEAVRIRSMVEFENYFGGPPSPQSIDIILDNANNVDSVNLVPKFYLYYCLRLFYDNGGGDCYIISVGKYDSTAVKDDFIKKGLEVLKKLDEPTLIVFPDAVILSQNDVADIQKSALSQCDDLMDRFGIFDVKDGFNERDYSSSDVVSVHRNGIGINALKYGASYYPWLKCSYAYNFNYLDISGHLKKKDATGTPQSVSLVSISPDSGSAQALVDAISDISVMKIGFYASSITVNSITGTYNEIFSATGFAGLQIKHWGLVIKEMAKKIINLYSTNQIMNSAIRGKFEAKIFKTYDLNTIVQTLTNYDYGYATVDPDNPLPADKVRVGIITDDGAAIPVINEFNGPPADLNYALVNTAPDSSIYGASPATASTAAANAKPYFTILFEKTKSIMDFLFSESQLIEENSEDSLLQTNPIYAKISDAIKQEAMTLPPSAAIAGIYTQVDNKRGVFKAPANISLNSVIAPAVSIDNHDQEDLNVDVNAGKSINAIRTFTGKGVLVWGARTLAGNDNEWRYISVRRFFNMVEESVKKATYWAVFEPNDANTWIRVKSMIENYLILKWKEGALTGAKPEQAFFVRVGLGSTMTAQDILEGRMIVKIGMAVVRPAEFIILQFSHKMQEA